MCAEIHTGIGLWKDLFANKMSSSKCYFLRKTTKLKFISRIDIFCSQQRRLQDSLPVADLGRHSTPPPPPRAPKFFQFHAVFGKILQNRMLAPPPPPPREVDAPPPGEILDPPLPTDGHQPLEGLTNPVFLTIFHEKIGFMVNITLWNLVVRTKGVLGMSLGTVYFIFMHFSAKILSSIQSYGWSPVYGTSWARQWLLAF